MTFSRWHNSHRTRHRRDFHFGHEPAYAITRSEPLANVLPVKLLKGLALTIAFISSNVSVLAPNSRLRARIRACRARLRFSEAINTITSLKVMMWCEGWCAQLPSKPSERLLIDVRDLKEHAIPSTICPLFDATRRVKVFDSSLGRRPAHIALYGDQIL
jgi:hypothetical protein